MNWEKIKSYLLLLTPLLKALVILVAGYFLTLVIAKIVSKAMTKAKLDVSLVSFVVKVVKIVLYCIVVMSALSALGVSTTGIIAAFSAAGVAVALALKDSLSNIAGGIILLLAPRFSTGDYVQVGSHEGRVISVDMMHTTLRTVQNLQVAIPNGVLLNSEVVNYSKEATRRVDIDFPVSYDCDVTVAKEAIKRVVEADPKALKDPAPTIRVAEYADSAVNISLKVWTKSETFFDLKFDLIENVRVEFDKVGVQIPYNQLDVHIKKDDDK